MDTLINPNAEGSAEDVPEKKPDNLIPPAGADKISPSEEDLKDLMKKSPDKIEDGQESQND